MCKKCSFDEGAGFKNDCTCKCDDLDWVDHWKGKGDVMGCHECSHLINGFFKQKKGEKSEWVKNPISK